MGKIFRILSPFLFSAIWGWAIAALAQGQIFLTPTYRVEIERLCAEGVVVCDRVRYRGTNRKTGEAVELMGRTHHTTASDGVTPGRFLGYVFTSEEYKYLVIDGRLQVLRGNEVIWDEAGEWQSFTCQNRPSLQS